MMPPLATVSHICEMRAFFSRYSLVYKVVILILCSPTAPWRCELGGLFTLHTLAHSLSVTRATDYISMTAGSSNK